MAEKQPFNPSIMASPQVLNSLTDPPPKPKPLTFDQKANIAFGYLTELTRERYKFTNEQMDIGVKLPLQLLPPNDQETITDVARHNGVPLWQAVWAQFRRCNENGFAYALLLDLGWIQEEVTRLEERECPECHTMFPANNQGQKFCGNICGSAEERRAIEMRRPKDLDDPAIPASSEAPGIVPIGAENVLAGN